MRGRKDGDEWVAEIRVPYPEGPKDGDAEVMFRICELVREKVEEEYGPGAVTPFGRVSELR